MMWAVIVLNDTFGRKLCFIKSLCLYMFVQLITFYYIISPYFDDVNAIIFMAAISSFDQTLEEAPNVNRMNDAIQLFRSICNHDLFKNTSIILFLNKIDILQNKLTFAQLKDYFPDYKGILVI